MPAPFQLDPRDAIFLRAVATSTKGAAVLDVDLVQLARLVPRSATPAEKKEARDALNKCTGPLRKGWVSQSPTHGLYRKCHYDEFVREWRCEYLVFSEPLERQAAALRFAGKDPPFKGISSFAADARGARVPPPPTKKRVSARTPGASGVTPNEKRSNTVSPDLRDDDADVATLLCGRRDWADAVEALRAATDAERAAALAARAATDVADAARAAADADRAAADAERATTVAALKLDLAQTRRALAKVTGERDVARERARRASDDARKLCAKLERSKNNAGATGDVDFIEDQVCTLEDELAACRGELKMAFEKIEAFKEPRVMKRVRNGSVNAYPLLVREFAMRAMGTGASAPQVVKFFRIAHLFFVPHLVEGEDYLVPSAWFFKESRRMIGPFSDMLRAYALSLAECHFQLCLDEASVDGRSYQAEVTTVEGAAYTRVHRQAFHTAVETSRCLKRAYAEDQLFLDLLKDECRRSGVPFSEGTGVDLGKLATTMNDTTVAAKNAAKLIGELAIEARKEWYTAAEWAALPECEKKCYNWDCLNHIMCLPIVEYLREEKALNKAQTDMMDNVAKTAWRERMGDLGLDEFMRAVLKLFSTQGASGVYAKGDRERFLAFMREKYPDEVWVSMGRGELGSRFLWVLVAAFGAHYNLEVGMIEYLTACLATEANVLRDSVFVKATSIFVMSKLRIASIMYDKFFNPLKAIVNSNLIGKDPCEMAPLLDHALAVARRLADADSDPLWFMTKAYRVFEDIPGLDEWEAHALKREQRSVGGNGAAAAGPGPSVKMVPTLAKIREVMYKGDADPDYPLLKPHFITHLQTWGRAIVTSFERSAGAFLSPNGKYCVANQDVHMKKAAAECSCVDDAAERAFAVLKFYTKRFPSASSATLCGLVAAVTNYSLDLVPAPVVYETKHAAERRAEIARHGKRLTIDTIPEAQKNAALRAASKAAFELSKKLAAAKEKEDYEHRQMTQTAALLAKEAASKAAYEEALGVYANHR
mmetsp:Transcript_7198/g.25691  ORF Transcript_7198/g.25691 Transcript_7198/m.25691 type:complete len:997 (+) Transcript_7198:268-3258(+)